MNTQIEKIFTNLSIVFIILFLLAIYMFRIIDKLLEHMFIYHKDEWIRANKPSGLFFRPFEADNIQSMISMQINLFKWFFITPNWIKKDKIAKNYLKIIRLIIIASSLIILVIFGYVVSLIIATN